MPGTSGRIHYREQFVRCGKASCSRCTEGPGHGPYWYAVWREGRCTRTRYVGKTLPPEVATAAIESEPPAAPQAGARALDARRLLQGDARRAELHVGAAKRRAHRPARKDVSAPARDLRIWTLGRFHVECDGVVVAQAAWRRQAAT